ncbi:MAG: PilX N-terminal domain-containing pilus assembly protein [Aquisalimonadaceae bacterium]
MLNAGSTRGQKGIALISGLVLLLVMTLLGVTAMSMATMEEYMARNLRDHNLGFEAAEAALRAGEGRVRTTLTAGPGSLPTTEKGFFDADDDAWLQALGDENSHATPVNHVARDARFVVEEMTVRPPPGESLTRGPYFLYRVTGVGYGAGTNDHGEPLARVVLQSIYVR